MDKNNVKSLLFKCVLKNEKLIVVKLSQVMDRQRDIIHLSFSCLNNHFLLKPFSVCPTLLSKDHLL